MFARNAFIILALGFAITPGFAQQPAHTQVAVAHAQQLHDEEVQALRSDLARMKALVAQMETNLAFVDKTESPLKHQFQLEIDMWKTVIGQMERRLGPGKAR